MPSQLGRLLHSLWRGRETRGIHTVATTRSENHRSLPTCHSGSNRLLTHALADTYDTMGKTASQALGIDEESPPQSHRGLEPQTVQRVESARDTVQPSCQAP